jgi:type II secretory pathway predicted ATPase ExeA/nucleoid-associated protein YgaU
MYGYYTNRGFTALIAPPGLGKTTLLFRFLEDIQTSARTVFLFDAFCEPLELVSYMLRDLEITPGRNGVEMREQLKDVLVREARAGRRFVVVIDEAQNMSDDALEMVRLLTNFETPRAKLMQIVLSGQPKLSDKLMMPSLEQLRQRISTFCRLEPLSAEQTAAYIDHRLKRAGYAGPQLFTEDALKLLTDASRGIPRTINNLCFNALTLTCALRRKQVDVGIAAEAIADQQLTPELKEVSSAAPEIVTKPKVESEELERSGSAVKPWAVAAAVLLVASVLSALAFPKVAPSWSQAKAEARKLFVKVPPSIHAVQAATEIGDASVAQSNSRPTSFQVVVGPNQRLSDIATKYLGNFDQERLHQIQALNPKLTDPDHIEVGQTLWLPGLLPVKQPDTEIPRLAPESPSEQTTAGKAKVAGTGTGSKSFEITVEPNQTLQDIAMKYLGDFNLKRLHQIEALNPKLTDPDHIRLGQKIRLPRPPSVPVATNHTPTASLGRLP